MTLYIICILPISELSSHEISFTQRVWIGNHGETLGIYVRQCRTEQCGKGLLVEFLPNTERSKEDDEDDAYKYTKI